ncbi:phenylalanine--tRNA ligase subunit beta, partial [Candidatus Saccharibacteria bacterium]|nr:phenylalanine--tRNA ligase subunit beta [Candidatus Saccharibacteria bacterium]NIV03104.1 phenylalanine--tRNA ligase subunit beta [Calditrichia bacterium]NIS37627.1 phenylalanine--tRNA ligase subunit beta [Candidatus Saccharibacteria bacterium]NIV71214.1 phenylalanine--tRNA ligase subunit beta [Calditrichia bacterium]NIV97660.1 phenylalanine--tRNA ligase subunit beta [Candidatus Saccharibacteria bacterium]
VDQKKFKLDQGPLQLNLEFLNRKIGVAVPKKQVIDILSGLGFEVTDKESTLSVKIPTWRATKDIAIPEDLIEEVARIYGYDNITPALPAFEILPPEENKLRRLENKVIDVLVGLGLSEVKNYSFLSEKDLDELSIDKKNCLRVKNPMSEDQRVMRPHLLPNLLKNV